MLYNENIYYNQPGLTFTGTLLIYVPEISSPIVLNDILIKFSNDIDNSNSTTIGVITLISVTTGSISIEVNQEQASALVEASVLNINEYSEVSVEY